MDRGGHEDLPSGNASLNVSIYHRLNVIKTGRSMRF